MANDWGNVSVDDYLRYQLGPRRLPMAEVVPITTLYALIFVSGILGNICVCVVIARIASMHTATNYYLFSLAVSDLLLLIFGLPYDVLLFWHQYPWSLGEAVCKLRALVSEGTSYASVLTIVAFTSERYVAICHPMRTQTMSSLPRVVGVIGLTWTVALLAAAPFAFFTRVHYTDFPPKSGRRLTESAFCSVPPEDNLRLHPLLLVSSFAFFIIPVFIITVLYLRIAVALRRSAGIQADSTGNQGEGKRRVILRMLVGVVIAFVICWTPFHAQRLLFVYDDARHWPESIRRLNEILYFAGGFYYFNCTINPILYNVMSAKYRDAFKETLCWFMISSPNTPSPRTSSRRIRASWDGHCKVNGVKHDNEDSLVDDGHSNIIEEMSSVVVQPIHLGLPSSASETNNNKTHQFRFFWIPLASKIRSWMKRDRTHWNDDDNHTTVTEPDTINRPEYVWNRINHGTPGNDSAFATEVQLGIVRETQV